MWMTKDGPFVWVLLAVGSGAAIGAMLRWALSLWLNARIGTFPLGTLVCNLAGAFVIGLVLSWLAATPAVSAMVRLFLVTGLLGALTTFSTFSAESVALISSARYANALMHIGAHLFGSLAMTAAGIAVWRWICD